MFIIIVEFFIFLFSLKLILIHFKQIFKKNYYNDPNKDNKTEPKYGILFHIYGLGLIILSSSIGTVLPLLLKNKFVSMYSMKISLK